MVKFAADKSRQAPADGLIEIDLIRIDSWTRRSVSSSCKRPIVGQARTIKSRRRKVCMDFTPSGRSTENCMIRSMALLKPKKGMSWADFKPYYDNLHSLKNLVVRRRAAAHEPGRERFARKF